MPYFLPLLTKTMFSGRPFCLHNADSVLLPVSLFPIKPLFLLSSTQGSTELVNPFAFVREREMRSLSKTGSNDKMWVYWVISPGARRLHETVFLKQQHPKVTERVRLEIQDGDFLKSLITGVCWEQYVGLSTWIMLAWIAGFGGEFVLVMQNLLCNFLW